MVIYYWHGTVHQADGVMVGEAAGISSPLGDQDEAVDATRDLLSEAFPDAGYFMILVEAVE